MAVNLPEPLSAPGRVLAPPGTASEVVTPRAEGPRLNSGLGVAGLSAAMVSAAPPDADGRFTVGEAGRNILRGVVSVVTEMWEEIKAHPVKTIAEFIGMAVLSTLLPIVGTAVMVLELGQAAFKIGSGVLKAVGLLRADKPDDAERALSGVGQGLGEIGLVALEGWLEKVIDVNRAIPKTVLTAFRRLRTAIGRLFRGGRDDPD
jgi:hypothetical protein